VYLLEDEELEPLLEEDRDEEPEDLPLDPPEYPWPPPGRASRRAVAKPSSTMARIRRMRAAGIVMSRPGVLRSPVILSDGRLAAFTGSG